MPLDNSPFPGAQPIPVIRYDEARATLAFEAYQAILKAEKRNAKLRTNPAWVVLRLDALENFTLAFGGEA